MLKENTEAQGIKDNGTELVEHVAFKFESQAQSGDVVDLLNAYAIQATEILAGGVTQATSARVKEDTLDKHAVDAIKNTDFNCFGYALVMLMHRIHAKWKIVRHGGQQLRDLAVELANKCYEVWDLPMSSDYINKV